MGTSSKPPSERSWALKAMPLRTGLWELPQVGGSIKEARWEQESAVNTQGSLQRDYRFGNRPVRMAAPLGDVTKKNHCTVCSKGVHFLICKTRLNKAVKKKKKHKRQKQQKAKEVNGGGGVPGTV